jgi:DNA repair ATPase RecN
MGFGSTAKTLQKVVDIADELYTKLSEVKTQLQALRGTVEETNARVDEMDRRLAEQRALVEAVAEEQGIDVDAVLTEAVIEDAEEATDGEPADTEGETTDGAPADDEN